MNLHAHVPQNLYSSFISRCAYLVADVQQYISTAIELIGRDSKLSHDGKTSIQMNLNRVVNREVPEAEVLTPLDKNSSLSSESNHLKALEQANLLWKHAMSESQTYNVAMNKFVPFVECKTSFQSAEVFANEPVILHVYVQTSCPFPIRFSQLNVYVGNREYDEQCVIADTNSGDLYLEPNKLKHLMFTFPPDARDVGESIQVSSIVLKLGAEANTVLFTWDLLAAVQTRSTVRVSTKQMMQKDAAATVKKWSDINPILTCSILNRRPLVNVTIKHNPPALINEIYKVSIVMKSEEKWLIKDLRGTLVLENGQFEETIDGTYLGVDIDSILDLDQSTSKKLEFAIDSLAPGEECEKIIYFRLTNGGVTDFRVSIRYSVLDKVVLPKSEDPREVKCICISDHSLSIKAVPSFKLSSSLCNQDFGIFKHVAPGCRFINMITIECCSPWPVELQSGTISLAGEIVTTVNGLSSNILQGIILEQGETANDVTYMMCKKDVIFPGKNWCKNNLSVVIHFCVFKPIVISGIAY